MAFMVPQYVRGGWVVETSSGDSFCVPFDLVSKAAADLYGAEAFEDYQPSDLHGDIEGWDLHEKAWFARLSAPGYLDCTDWRGPFKTEKEAFKAIEDAYNVDPMTGDDLD